MEHKSGSNREQITMSSLEELVEGKSAARFIDKFVNSADTSYFEKAVVKSTGRPPYNPKDMLKLYIYGMENGIISSRKLERECKRNIELMWLLNKLTPESKTICNFRRDNKDNLVRFFREFCVTLVKAGHIDGKLMAIDGTKIRANNSKRNNFSAKKLDRHIDYINEKIALYLKDIENADKLAEYEDRKAKYKEFKDIIESGEVNEVSTTDPDARLMSAGNNGVDVSYNIQSVVDSKNKMICGMAVTTNAADFGQLGEVMPVVKEELGLEEVTVLADKGYYKTEDFYICEQNNITTIVAKNDDAERNIFALEAFIYEQDEDVYYCPHGDKLYPGKADCAGFKEYKNNRACKNCPLKANCTKGIRRVIKRHIHKACAERNDLRLKNNQKLYKQRQMLVEHPFGTIKRTMGIRQFSTRRIAGVTAEVALIFLCYNLKRLRKILQQPNKNDGNIASFMQYYRQISKLFFLLLIFYKTVTR